MDDVNERPPDGDVDVLAAVTDELERAEDQDDEARLAVLDRSHARLSSELDAPGPLEQ